MSIYHSSEAVAMIGSGSKYFTENFQSSYVTFDELRERLYERFASFSGNSDKEIARQIKEYCQENGIRLKTSKQNSASQSTRTTRCDSGNINITINENRGLSFWDYLLLKNLFSNKQQPIIINNAPTPMRSTSSKSQQDESKEKSSNVLLFIAALCVIMHLAVCAIYHMYFKKEAEKPGQSIEYLANRQLGIAIFQLGVGLASFVTGGTFLNQSEVFFPLLINTFICLGSACLFYNERNNTIKTEVEPYKKLAKLLKEDEYKRNHETRTYTGASQNFGHHNNEPPPPYTYQDPSAPLADETLYPQQPVFNAHDLRNLSSQFENPNVTMHNRSGYSKY